MAPLQRLLENRKRRKTMNLKTKKRKLYQAVFNELIEMGMRPKHIEAANFNNAKDYGISMHLNAVTITKTVGGTEERIAHAVYLDDFVDDDLLGMIEENQLTEAANSIAYQMVEHVVNQNSTVRAGSKPTERELLRLPFILALCDKELNEKFLSDKPHIDVENGFALFLRIKVSEGSEGVYITNVTENMLKELKLTKEEAFEKAFAEAERSDTELCDISEFLTQPLVGGKPTNLLNDIGSGKSPRKAGVYVLNDRLHGAAALYRPGMKEKIAEILNDDFYVIPSSIHELVIVPAGKTQRSERELGRKVKEVNKNRKARNEILSYKVQKFSRNLGKLISCVDMPKSS